MPDAAQAARILVVGDVMLDQSVVGPQTRRAPESGVPVLEVGPMALALGGAANAAANVRALGASCVVAGVIGHDHAATQLRELLVKRRARHPCGRERSDPLELDLEPREPIDGLGPATLEARS